MMDPAMRTPRPLLPALLAALLLAFLAPAAHAESHVSLFNGDRFTGPVPAGEVIRVKMFMVKGSQPRLRLNVTSLDGPRLSFTSGDLDVPATELFLPDDDGNEQHVATVPNDRLTFRDRPRGASGRTLSLRGFDKDALPDGAPKTGWYQLVVRTNNRLIRAEMTGRYTSKRKRRVVMLGDETNTDLGVELVNGDEIRRFSVRRKGKTSDAPTLERILYPSGLEGTPTQKTNRRGSRTIHPIPVRNVQGGTGEGAFTFRVAYQEGGQAGEFRAVLRVKPRRSNATVPVQIRNAPGIPLSVRPIPERFLDVTQIGVHPNNMTPFADSGSDVGIATDDEFLYVTAQKDGQLHVRRLRFDLTLLDQDFLIAPWTLTNIDPSPGASSDLPSGEALGTHRLLRAGDHLYAVVSSASGQSGLIYRFEVQFDPITGDTTFGVRNRRSITPAGQETTIDLFAATDGTSISVGLYVGSATVSHHVYRYDADTLAPIGLGPQEIGRASESASHTSAAGAQFRTLVDANETPYYELWAPDNLNQLGPSDLHRQQYAPDWSVLVAPDRDYDDVFDYDGDGNFDQRVELSPTAVSVDQQITGNVTGSGATIVHYIVRDPQTGRFRIHRRLFDIGGNEIPDSHFVVDESDPDRTLGRPISLVLNENASRSHVYLGYTTPTGPEILRYRLVR
jgi:hypothetical protein